jgi:hypothetical protein
VAYCGALFPAFFHAPDRFVRRNRCDEIDTGCAGQGQCREEHARFARSSSRALVAVSRAFVP